MANFVTWIVAGGVLGYLASRVLPGYTAAGTMLNILTGVVGGFVSGLVLKSALLALDPQIDLISLWALAAALSGATLLLAVVNLPASRTGRAAVARAGQKPPE